MMAGMKVLRRQLYANPTTSEVKATVTELRLMAVHAHPDDESSKGAATTAKYADEGHRVMVVTLTGGERGDILNPAMDLPEVHGRIADVRRDEMAKAADILGVEHAWARIPRFRVARRRSAPATAGRLLRPGATWRCPPSGWCG